MKQIPKNDVKTLLKRLYQSPAWQRWSGMKRAGMRNFVEYVYFWHYEGNRPQWKWTIS